MLCEAWAFWRSLEQFDRPGRQWQETESGYAQPHPGHQARQAAAARLAQWLEHFGLMPVVRDASATDLPEYSARRPQ